MDSVKLLNFPCDKYTEYRYKAIFGAYKWDPQVGDHNTLAKHIVVLDKETACRLEGWAEKLSEETISMEEAVLKNLPLAKKLGLPKEIIKILGRLKNYDRNGNIRLMRFDFHPIETGWAVSEVNSDVPGGLAEASVLPGVAGAYFNGCEQRKNVAESLFDAFRAKVGNGGRIAFVHATSYSDDRQVMQFISDYFAKNGFDTVFAAPDHIKWENKKAVCVIKGKEGNVDGIVRFFPLEWLTNLPKDADWRGYYDCTTPSCNHPIAIFAQSKRLPLVWDELGIDIPAWRQLLPQTADPKKFTKNDDWIYKPALGRVGEGISIKEAIPEKELLKIEKTARRFPQNWIVQRKFISRPAQDENGESFHLCVGVFTVNGKSAGFYGRMSRYPRIDDKAEDVPVLVSI